MDLFQHGSVSQMDTRSPKLYAFIVTGHVDDDTAEAMADFMNDAFDKHDDKVDMLLDLSAFTGSDWDSFLDFDVIKSRFRALSEVDKYAVIGAPEKAQKMIEWMDKIIPVNARAFDQADADKAWDWVGEKRLAA